MDIAQRLIAWQRQHGRHNLPWQQAPSAYHVWVSEVMLQQTQVATVIPYYQAFMAQWPTLSDLAQASVDDVLALWTGLGYYRRARHLHQAAQQMVAEGLQDCPADTETLMRYPGIGRSTAGAIASLGHHQRAPILDGNVKRVYARLFAIDTPIQAHATLSKLWAIAERLSPDQDCHHFNQGLMDLGASVCTPTSPSCPTCPLQDNCQAQDPLAYPVKAPKKAIPTLTKGWMIVSSENRQQILVEQQPETGIWAKLWCPLLCHDPHAWPQGLPTCQATPLPTITHTFSHQRWQLQRQHATLNPDNFQPKPPWRWVRADELDSLGMPGLAKRWLTAWIQHEDIA